MLMARMTRVTDGPSFGFGVFCGEDMNASRARFAETKTRLKTQGGVI